MKKALQHFRFFIHTRPNGFFGLYLDKNYESAPCIWYVNTLQKEIYKRDKGLDVF